MKEIAICIGTALTLSVLPSVTSAASVETSAWAPPASQNSRSTTVVTPNSRSHIILGAGARAGASGNAVAGAGGGARATVTQTPNYVYIVPKAGSRARIAPPVHAVENRPAVVEPPPVEPVVPRSAINYLESNPVPDEPAPLPEEPVQPPEESTAVPSHSEQPAAPVMMVLPLPASKPKPAPAPPREKVQPISQVRGPLFDDNEPLLTYQKQHAEKGDPQAQYALGIRYLTGNGVEENFILGRQWLEKSSKNGNLRARAKLRNL